MHNICSTAQKMKFSIKDFFSKCDQIHSFLRIWSHLLKKSWKTSLFVQCRRFEINWNIAQKGIKTTMKFSIYSTFTLLIVVFNIMKNIEMCCLSCRFAMRNVLKTSQRAFITSLETMQSGINFFS